MRLIPAIAGVALIAHSAWAFDCSNATLPSSMVICSDAELIRIADERQAAVNEARVRLSPEQFRKLLDEQKGWIAWYSTSCGVPPEGGPPKLPVAPEIRACFKRAGEARTAYIRSFEVGRAAQAPPTQAAAVSDRLGPGFDCTKAKAPMALLICADPELSRVDLAFNQAYWALMEELDDAGRRRLKQEDNAFLDGVVARCGLGRDGGLSAETWRARDCVKREYEAKRAQWIGELSDPDASEEATRALEAHIALERKLRQLGFLTTPQVAPEGVYGPATRNAIEGWQEARGRETTRVLGNKDALALQREGAEPPPQQQPPPTAERAPGAPTAPWQSAMNAWYGCLREAVVALASQPEPAQTVADAAFGSCTKAEAEFQSAAKLDWDAVEKIKADTVRKQVIANVMALRAATDKLREKPTPSQGGSPEPKPAIEYNRM